MQGGGERLNLHVWDSIALLLLKSESPSLVLQTRVRTKAKLMVNQDANSVGCKSRSSGVEAAVPTPIKLCFGLRLRQGGGKVPTPTINSQREKV